MFSEIESALRRSFEDHQLSKGEKTALKEVFRDLVGTPEKLSFVRNRSFDLVREHLEASRRFHLEALKWLEGVVRLVDSVRSEDLKTETSVHFSPGKSCVGKVVSLIKNAKASIDVCVFTISDDRIAEALIEAHKKGVELRVLTDDEKTSDLGSDIDRLASEGIAVKTDDSPSHMHHKYAVFDGTILVNGSFNWTRSASMSNHENIVVTNDPECVVPFKNMFEKLWKECIPHNRL